MSNLEFQKPSGGEYLPDPVHSPDGVGGASVKNSGVVDQAIASSERQDVIKPKFDPAEAWKAFETQKLKAQEAILEPLERSRERLSEEKHKALEKIAAREYADAVELRMREENGETEEDEVTPLLGWKFGDSRMGELVGKKTGEEARDRAGYYLCQDGRVYYLNADLSENRELVDHGRPEDANFVENTHLDDPQGVGYYRKTISIHGIDSNILSAISESISQTDSLANMIRQAFNVSAE
jgi:hypothetical protein